MEQAPSSNHILNGGYIHAREGDNRKAGWFEAIVGKSLHETQSSKRFGFVCKYDDKPKSRLNTMLQKQGFQMNQEIVFLSDGGDTVKNLQKHIAPYSEHLLDWFHIYNTNNCTETDDQRFTRCFKGRVK